MLENFLFRSKEGVLFNLAWNEFRKISGRAASKLRIHTGSGEPAGADYRLPIVSLNT